MSAAARLGADLTARAANLTPLTRRLARAAGRRHAAAILAGRAGRTPRWFGAPVAVLETTGARTGLPRRAPVLVLEDGGRLVVLAANGGATRAPAWWHNLSATPAAHVSFRGTRSAIRAREAEGDERDRLWRAFAAMYPAAERYASRAGRAIPVVVLEPA